MHAIAALEVNVQYNCYEGLMVPWMIIIMSPYDPEVEVKNMNQIIWLPLHTLYYLSPDVPEQSVSLTMNTYPSTLSKPALKGGNTSNHPELSNTLIRETFSKAFQQ